MTVEIKTIEEGQLSKVLAEVGVERLRQEAKFPEQRLPNGTDWIYNVKADAARARCDIAADCGEVTWRHILEEEFFEALAEEVDEELRIELIQVAAVAVRWIEDIDRRAQEDA